MASYMKMRKFEDEKFRYLLYYILLTKLGQAYGGQTGS